MAHRPQALSPQPGQREDYEAVRAKSVVELQPFRAAESAAIAAADGAVGRARLLHLNPAINSWFLLELDWGRGALPAYHLENSDPAQEIWLDPSYPSGLVLALAGRATRCDLWSAGDGGELAAARRSGTTYAALCGGRLWLRNPTAGRRSTLEWATDFLRDRVWGGERITVFVRERFYQDAFLETSELLQALRPSDTRAERPTGAPLPARVDPQFATAYLVPDELGLQLQSDTPGRVLVGRWYAVAGVTGVYFSALRANLVAPEVIQAMRGRLNPLDEVDESALVYTVAFDLDRFTLRFALGTEHPRVGWSERVPEAMVTPGLPGPDGIGDIAPLVATGQVRPDLLPRLAGTFIGGFKRGHGAFKTGELSRRNGGSHYGFLEQGTVLSKPQPGLATVVVDRDGRTDLVTWSEEMNGGLESVRSLRQNGVPVIEPDPATGEPRPGALVPRWADGNWSGSADKRLRTVRAGLCLQESAAGRYLLYSYFSSATPSAMARVESAYGCRYAMLLDMNALEHTYLALYRRSDSTIAVQHLIGEMSVLDRSAGDQELPRFVGLADNRDFFYLLRKEGP